MAPARGWALWEALISIREDDPERSAEHLRTIEEVFADPVVT